MLYQISVNTKYLEASETGTVEASIDLVGRFITNADNTERVSKNHNL